MLQLIYASSATTPQTEEMLDLICEEATANNARDEVTGVLLHHDGSFLQVLEGPQTHVENTFLRIVVDPRHSDVSLLSRRLLTRREFGDWAMAEVRDGPNKRDVLDRVRSIVEQSAVIAQRTFDQRLGDA